MVFWYGFIAKVVEFIATKIIGKQVDLLADDKRKACKIFFRLYEHLSILESISEDVLVILRPVAKEGKTLVYYHFWKGMSEKVAHSSNEFLDIIKELGLILRLYDSSLGLLLGRISHFKFMVRFMVSDAFNPEYMKFKIKYNEAGCIDDVSWSQPIGDISLKEFDEKYKDIQEYRSNNKTGFNFIELTNEEQKWPNDALIIILRNQFQEESLRPIDVQQIQVLYDMVSEHIVSLKAARESLGNLIKSQFKIEDLLAVSKKTLFAEFNYRIKRNV